MLKTVFCSEVWPVLCCGKGGRLKTGPNLHGLCGWKTGQGPGFSYTDAKKDKGYMMGLL